MYKNDDTERSIQPGQIYIFNNEDLDYLNTIISKQEILPDIDRINIDLGTAFTEYDTVDTEFVQKNISPFCLRPLKSSTLKKALVDISFLLNLSGEKYLSLFAKFIDQYSKNMLCVDDQPISSIDDVFTLLQYEHVRSNIDGYKDCNLTHELHHLLDMLSDNGDINHYNKILYVQGGDYLRAWSKVGISSSFSVTNEEIELGNTTIFCVNGNLSKQTITALNYYVMKAIFLLGSDAEVFISEPLKNQMTSIVNSLKGKLSMLNSSESYTLESAM